MNGAQQPNLDLANLQAELKTRWLGRSLEVRQATKSTNDDARAAQKAGKPHGHLVVADQQTSGRGAHGSTWSSPAGCDLYFSFVHDCPLADEKGASSTAAAGLTLAVGLALARAADQVLKDAGQGQASEQAPQARIKWPNDLWFNAKKCAGVLTETSTLGGRLAPVVVGVGLNVNRTHWPPELRSSATSLSDCGGQPLDRIRVLGTVLSAIENACEELRHKGLPTDDINARLLWRGEQVTDGRHVGLLLGVNEDGSLSLQTGDRLQRLYAGRIRRIDWESRLNSTATPNQS